MELAYFGSSFSDYGIVIGLAVILILAIVLIIFFARFSPKKTLNKEEYQSEWLKIMNACEVNETHSLAMAVIGADKLVDRAMQELNIPGKTMGDRLKSAPKRFSDINGLWAAHKLRNKLAHEVNFQVDKRTVAQAIASFKRALKDLGAI